MFDLFANASEGMLLVDRDARSGLDQRPVPPVLPALGFEARGILCPSGVRRVQNTQMHRAEDRQTDPDRPADQPRRHLRGQPHPLRDADGAVIGALGIVLFDHPRPTLQPVMEKFSLLQRDLDDASVSWPAPSRPQRVQRLSPTPSPASSAPARRRWR